jgi:hypothetical protein
VFTSFLALRAVTVPALQSYVVTVEVVRRDDADQAVRLVTDEGVQRSVRTSEGTMNSTDLPASPAPPEALAKKKSRLGRVLIVTGVVLGLGVAVTAVQDHGDGPA